MIRISVEADKCSQKVQLRCLRMRTPHTLTHQEIIKRVIAYIAEVTRESRASLSSNSKMT